MVASLRDEMCARVAGLAEDARKAVRYRILSLRSSLADLESSRAFDQVESTVRRLSQRVDDAVYSMGSALEASFKAHRARHTELALRLSETDLRRAMVERRSRLADLSGRLNVGTRLMLDRRNERISLAAGKLDSLSPLGVLSRGYAIAFDGHGRVIKRAADVNPGEKVRVRVSDGEMDCTRNN
jgi:exodeoxyribonuclease VII large subunit